MNYTIGEDIIHQVSGGVLDNPYSNWSYKVKVNGDTIYIGSVVLDGDKNADIYMNEIYESYLINTKISDVNNSGWIKTFEVYGISEGNPDVLFFTDIVSNIYNQICNTKSYKNDRVSLNNLHKQPYIKESIHTLINPTNLSGDAEVSVVYNRSNPMVYYTEMLETRIGTSLNMTSGYSPIIKFDKEYSQMTLKWSCSDSSLGDDWGVAFLYEDGQIDGSEGWVDSSDTIGEITRTQGLKNGLKIIGLVFNFGTGSGENGNVYKLEVYEGNGVGDSIVDTINPVTINPYGTHKYTVSDFNVDGFDSQTILSTNPTNLLPVYPNPITPEERETFISIKKAEINRELLCTEYILTWVGRDNTIYQFPFAGVPTSTTDYKHNSVYDRYNNANKYMTEVTNSWNLNTLLVDEEEMVLLESLMVSNDIQLYSYNCNKSIPVNITATNFKYKTFKNEGNPFNLRLDFKEKRTNKIR